MKAESQRSEDRGQRPEVRRRRSEGGGRRSGADSQSLEAKAPNAAEPKSDLRHPESALPPPSPVPLLILISAPSGGGKTTLCQELLAVRRDMTRAITCTTREPRAGEKDGVDYYFLDAGSFLKRVQAGNFLEHATVYGNSYGTLKAEVLDKLRQGKNVLLNIDVQGAAAVRASAEKDPELKRALVTVFLTPPSLGVLEARLKKRGTDSPAVIQKRLSVARQEIAQWKNFDYLIISDSIQDDLRRTLAIVDAEAMRTERGVAPEF
ncbi:MAG: guanylate kinase [Akkermansiaceae bacterium]|nr:guanylate kinase [Verrucomicrobiales bacterium]